MIGSVVSVTTSPELRSLKLVPSMDPCSFTVLDIEDPVIIIHSTVKLEGHLRPGPLKNPRSFAAPLASATVAPSNSTSDIISP